MAFLEATKSSNIYRDWMVNQPPPRIQQKLPLLPWDLTWKRLSGPLLPPEAVDLHFRALHNILLTMERRHRFGDAPSPHCPRCPTLVEDSLHFFTSCPRVAGAWDNILHRAILVSGLALTNRSLFYLGVGDKGPRGSSPTSRLSSQNCPGCCWRPASFSLLNFSSIRIRMLDPDSPNNDPWSKPSKNNR